MLLIVGILIVQSNKKVIFFTICDANNPLGQLHQYWGITLYLYTTHNEVKEHRRYRQERKAVYSAPPIGLSARVIAKLQLPEKLVISRVVWCNMRPRVFHIQLSKNTLGFLC
jgi:hypothetical protein